MILEEEKNTVAVSTTLGYEYPNVLAQLNTIDIIRKSLVELPYTKDFWCRDYMPIQKSDGEFIDFIYRPDYLVRSKVNKKYLTSDKGKLVAYRKLVDNEPIKSDIILDGGNVVFAKNIYGKSFAIMTEKVFYENDATVRDEASIKHISKELANFLGCEIIFLPWDIFDVCGHTDGIVNYISEGKLLVNLKLSEKYIANEIRERLTTANFGLIDLPLSDYHELSWAHINILRTKDFVAIPKLNRVTDKEAYDFIKNLLLQYGANIYQIDTEDITTKYGGALNCMSWTVKL